MADQNPGSARRTCARPLGIVEKVPSNYLCNIRRRRLVPNPRRAWTHSGRSSVSCAMPDATYWS